MAGGLDALAALHDGIPVPEYGVQVPWLIAESDLYRLIPESAFATSVGGWPMLRFTLLGITGVFGFNFVTHNEGKLLELRLQNDDESSLRQTFRDTSAILRQRLGTPNCVDMPEDLRWDDGRLWVDNGISTGYVVLLGQDVTSHALSVFAAFGLPQDGPDATGDIARTRGMTRVELLQDFVEQISKPEFPVKGNSAGCFKILYGVPLDVLLQLVRGYFDDYYRRVLRHRGNHEWLEEVFHGPHSWSGNGPSDSDPDPGLDSATTAFLFGAKYGVTPLYGASNFTICLGSLIHAQSHTVWAADDPEAVALDHSTNDPSMSGKERFAIATSLQGRSWFENVASIAVARREWTAIANRIREAKIQLIPLESASQMEADLREWLDCKEGWWGEYTFPASYHAEILAKEEDRGNKGPATSQ